MTTVEILIIVLGALAGLVTLPLVISRVALKVATASGKIANTADDFSKILENLGFEKAASIVAEGADIPDELEDLAELFADYTADQKLTTEEIRSLFQEGKELWVEMKDFRVKVFPKK